jgi:hypothetical protein
MLKAEPELCVAGNSNAKELNDLLADKESALSRIGWFPNYYLDYRSRRTVDSQVVLGRVAAVLFAAGDSRIAAYLPYDDQAKLPRQPRILGEKSRHSGDLGVRRVLDLVRKLDPQDPRYEAMRRLMVRWAGKQGNVKSLVMRFDTAIAHSLDGALHSLALQILRHRKQITEQDSSLSAQLAVPRALLILAKFAKKEDTPLIAPLLERSSPYSGGNFAPQDRDAALGLIVQLSGQRPDDYALQKCEATLGFPGLRITYYGFGTFEKQNDARGRGYDQALRYDHQAIERRNQGFALCVKNYKELGLDQPPSYQPLPLPPAPPFLFLPSGIARLKSVVRKTSPDGKTSLEMHDATARLVDVATGNAFGSVLLAAKEEFSQPPFTCWSFSPKGNLLATGAGFRDWRGDGNGASLGSVQIWDLTTGRLLTERKTGRVNSVAFGEDGKTVVFEAEGREINGP